MKKFVSLLVLLGVFCFTSSSYAATDVWLDEVIYWSDVPPLSGDDPGFSH